MPVYPCLYVSVIYAAYVRALPLCVICETTTCFVCVYSQLEQLQLAKGRLLGDVAEHAQAKVSLARQAQDLEQTYAVSGFK